MTEISERFDRIATGFAERVESVPAGAWDAPAPCEGWVARDVVRHLVEWVPGFFRAFAEIDLPSGPSVDVDPAGAWTALRDGLSGLLADPDTAERPFDSPPGRMSVAESIDMLVTGDLLVHTWDLARAVGLDERLDPEEVHRMYEGVLPMDEVLRQSGHYGPRVEVAEDADEQTKLLAFVGRHP